MKPYFRYMTLYNTELHTTGLGDGAQLVCIKPGYSKIPHEIPGYSGDFYESFVFPIIKHKIASGEILENGDKLKHEPSDQFSNPSPNFPSRWSWIDSGYSLDEIKTLAGENIELEPSETFLDSIFLWSYAPKNRNEKPIFCHAVAKRKPLSESRFYVDFFLAGVRICRWVEESTQIDFYITPEKWSRLSGLNCPIVRGLSAKNDSILTEKQNMDDFLAKREAKKARKEAEGGTDEDSN